MSKLFINRLNKTFIRSFAQENTKLKKKFYKSVDILEVKNPDFAGLKTNGHFKYLQNLSNLGEKYYHVLLDGRKCKTLYLEDLKLPKKKLALGIAEEFDRQKEDINFYSMHFVNTRLNRLVLLRLFINKNFW
jgi:chaperone required for assembly of F1-ATPase